MDRRYSSKLLDLAFDGSSDHENEPGMMIQQDRRGSESIYAEKHGQFNSARHDIELPKLSAVAHHEEMNDDGELVESVDPELFQAGIKEHARHLGIDLEHESEFLWIARESLVAPIPEGWHQHVTANGIPYYYNEQSGESRWDHPCDDQYRQLYRDMKAKKYESKHKQQQQQQQQQSYGGASTSYLGSDHSSTSSYHPHPTYEDYSTGGGCGDNDDYSNYGGVSSNNMDQHSNYGEYKSNYSSHQQAWDIQSENKYGIEEVSQQKHYYHRDKETHVSSKPLSIY
jgi:hypothetical protein